MSNYETYAKPCGHINTCAHDFEISEGSGEGQRIADALLAEARQSKVQCDTCTNWRETLDKDEYGLNCCEECRGW